MEKHIITGCIVFLEQALHFVKNLSVKTEVDLNEKIAAISLLETVSKILKKEK